MLSNRRRVGVSLFSGAWILVLVLSTLFATVQPAEAATAINIANPQTQTTAQAAGTGAVGSQVCTVWTQFDIRNPQIFFRLYNTATDTWTPALGTNPEQVTTGGDNGVPRCTIDSNGNAHVVWSSRRAGGGFIASHRMRATDGTWGPITEIQDYSGAVTKPDIDADNAGNVWVVMWLWGGDGQTSSLRFRKWNAASGWAAPKDLGTGGDAADPRIGVDNLGNVHTVFRNGNANGGISYVLLSAAGSFGPRLTVPDGLLRINYSPDIAVDRDNGTAHVTFIGDSSTNSLNQVTRVNYGRKGLADANFSAGKRIATGTDAVHNTTIAASPGGQLVVAFNNGNGKYVAEVRSSNNGDSWTGVEALTPVGKTANPWIVADQLGGRYLVYSSIPGRLQDAVHFVGIAGLFPEAERCAGFGDVHVDDPACAAIAALTREGIIRGYDTTPPTFGPNNPVQRAEMAAFLVRALELTTVPPGGKTYADLDGLTPGLRNAVLILANSCTPEGSENCVARGYNTNPPTFGPTDEVTYAQVIAFVTRAYIYEGIWTPQDTAYPDTYTGIPAEYQAHVRTFYHYTQNDGGVPGGAGLVWTDPAPRGWVALVLNPLAQYNPAP